MSSHPHPFDIAPISRQIWEQKYRLRRPDGRRSTPPSTTPGAALRGAAAKAEPGSRRAQGRLGRQVRRGPDGFRLPAGRPDHRRRGRRSRRHALQLLRHGARSTTISSSIFDNVKEAALTMQKGGGIGHDFSTLRPEGRAGPQRRRRRVGAGELHGRMGRDVPDHHVGRRAARRHDGDAALRSSRHRDLHRRQVRPGAAAQFQSVGAGHRRVHGRRRAPDGAWDLVFEGKVYAPSRRARCGTGSCARPTTTPSPA